MAAKNKIFALVDCNNFFVSCERIFRPDLEGKPVVVLSSNDGCAVARSNEAKQLGIPMGAPAFKFRQLFRDHNVTTFSGNFDLYGDISRRITSLLTTVTPRIEVYSVDESFLDLSELAIEDYEAWGRAVRKSIWRTIGVPVSIGIAPTKTLAKLASEIAKQHDEFGGAFSFFQTSKALSIHPDPQSEERATFHRNDLKNARNLNMEKEKLENWLAKTPIREVWGVGRQLAPKLRAEGIGTALALAHVRPQLARQLMGVHGTQLVAELNGTSCLGLTPEKEAAKSIMRSRTFGEDTNQAHVVEAALASMSARAAFYLRNQNLLAYKIGFFVTTNRHKPGYRKWFREVTLVQPTQDTGQIISLLTEKLGEIFSDKQQYHRLGVFLYDLTPADALQTDLLGHVDPESHDRSNARMKAIDAINAKHGRNKIRFAAEGLSVAWQPRKQIRSPRYVSHWSELPKARIFANVEPRQSRSHNKVKLKVI